MEKTIYLQKIGDIDQDLLTKLKKNLKLVLRDYINSVKILKDEVEIMNFLYNPKSKQYEASNILDFLKKDVADKNHFRTLGIINADIYSQKYDFIFGLARYPKTDFLKNNGVAIISIARLKEDFYRRPEDKPKLFLRTLKEAIHELGHTFNLKHCKNNCVMRLSDHLADTDEKPPEYCEKCVKELNNFFNVIK